jgi:hypothetical protein
MHLLTSLWPTVALLHSHCPSWIVPFPVKLYVLMLLVCITVVQKFRLAAYQRSAILQMEDADHHRAFKTIFKRCVGSLDLEAMFRSVTVQNLLYSMQDHVISQAFNMAAKEVGDDER